VARRLISANSLNFQLRRREGGDEDRIRKAQFARRNRLVIIKEIHGENGTLPLILGSLGWVDENRVERRLSNRLLAQKKKNFVFAVTFLLLIIVVIIVVVGHRHFQSKMCGKFRMDNIFATTSFLIRFPFFQYLSIMFDKVHGLIFDMTWYDVLLYYF